MQYRELRCLSCSIKCEILPLEKYRSSQCLNGKICIWPETNFMFQNGITSIINSMDIISSVAGFIFVDFSWGNIHAFLNDRWIEYLAQTKMTIILVSDQKMAPLAAYYDWNDRHVSGCIYVSDGISSLTTSMRKLFFGQAILRTKNKKALTSKEKEVFLLTLNNYQVADISKRMLTDAKAIYNLRQRIEYKLGMKIRRYL
ncbi:LuxR family transcriptional regulator [Enterobacter oligotrophicus]|nr:LuxR family transcriptional regulator [Enterobacter oligotrophicus]